MTSMTAIAADPISQTLEELTIERPTPGPIDVLIKVEAAGINPVDSKTRVGAGVNGFFPADQPMILGWDVAGVVAQVGAGVTRFAVGDRVFGMPRFPHPAGGYAEYVTAPSRQVARIPDAVSSVDAAALPLAALTAWQAIEALQIDRDSRLLIHAASGGVGHLAVQFAKAKGAEVWGTASQAKHAALRDLGLDHPIDYRTQRFEEFATDMDAVLDLVGSGDYPARSVATLRSGGKLIVVPSPGQLPDQQLLDDAGVTASWILVEPDYAALEKIAAMIVDGSLKVVVGDTRPLAQVGELHSLLDNGGPLGKLVATVVG